MRRQLSSPGTVKSEDSLSEGDEDPNLSPQARKNPRKQQPSSLEIFLKHVTYKEKEIDVKGIFSKSCFNEWLETRNSQIKHPEHSFQRALYAHVKGKDHRRPFPEDVEQALLVALRRPSFESPWRDVFSESSINVGRRGFKQKGYHESLKCQVPENTNSSNARNSTSASSSSLILSPKHEHSYEDQLIPAQFAQSSFSISSSLDFNANSYVSFTMKPSGGRTPWDYLVAAMQKYFKMEVRGPALEQLILRKIDIYTPAVYYFLNQMPPENDIRFNWSFLMPPDEYKYFLDDRPIARIVMDKRWVFFEEDENAIKIFGESKIDTIYAQLFQSRVSLLFGFIRHISELTTNGVVWRRDIFRRAGGTAFVVFFKLERICNDAYAMTFQDHSDFFPDVLARPFFI